jgi:hypothetical protein
MGIAAEPVQATTGTVINSHDCVQFGLKFCYLSTCTVPYQLLVYYQVCYYPSRRPAFSRLSFEGLESDPDPTMFRCIDVDLFPSLFVSVFSTGTFLHCTATTGTVPAMHHAALDTGTVCFAGHLHI